MKNKTAIAFTLVLFYAVALLKPAFPLVDYFIQLNEYKKRCINQSRPEMHCNGQCILMQKIMALEADNGSATPPAPVKLDLKEYPIGLITTSNIRISLDRNRIAWNEYQVVPDKTKFDRDIFHPPSSLIAA